MSINLRKDPDPDQYFLPLEAEIKYTFIKIDGKYCTVPTDLIDEMRNIKINNKNLDFKGQM